MDFVLNRPVSMIDSDGNRLETYRAVNCKVNLDTNNGEAEFFEEKEGEFILVSIQPWECLPDGTRKDFTTEAQCVDFYKKSNHHVEA